MNDIIKTDGPNAVFAELAAKLDETAMSPKLMSMHEARKRLGVTARTLRFWEERGLIKADRSRHERCYTSDELNYAKVILNLQEFAFSIADIKRVIDALRTLRGETRDAVERHEAIETLRKMADLLEKKVRLAQHMRGYLKRKADAASELSIP